MYKDYTEMHDQQNIKPVNLLWYAITGLHRPFRLQEFETARICR